MTAYQLQQRGRASIDFLTDLRRCSNPLESSAVIRDLQPPPEFDHPKPGSTLDFTALHTDTLHKLTECREFRVLRLVREWMLQVHGYIAMDAFAELPEAVATDLDAARAGNTGLRPNNELTLPAYWQGYEFHRSAGGWDGHAYMGFVHGELIHTQMVGRALAGVLHGQRRAAAAVAGDAPARILEIGCASGQFTAALAETYPHAKITALDLSLRQLEQTQRRGNALGANWQLLQAAAESSGLDSNSFELVCSYAVFHELPAAVAAAVMAEKFRLCTPGGTLLMADVKPYSAQSAAEVWHADFWNQEVGGDPFWREYAMTDFVALAEQCGFIDIAWRGLGHDAYPYVLTGRKPATEVRGE